MTHRLQPDLVDHLLTQLTLGTRAGEVKWSPSPVRVEKSSMDDVESPRDQREDWIQTIIRLNSVMPAYAVEVWIVPPQSTYLQVWVCQGPIETLLGSVRFGIREQYMYTRVEFLYQLATGQTPPMSKLAQEMYCNLLDLGS